MVDRAIKCHVQYVYVTATGGISLTLLLGGAVVPGVGMGFSC